jgi:histidinol-phosphate aminotransferase
VGEPPARAAAAGGDGTAPRLGRREDLAALTGYHSPQVAVDVRLNTNESPYPPPAAWREAVLEELATLPFHRYPDREATALREAIGELHGVGPDQVLAANGSNEVLQLLCLAYGGRGRAAAVFEPTYQLHAHIARVTGTGVVVGSRRRDFGLDPEEVSRVLRQTSPAITFLCSPNNPTGTVDDPDAVASTLAESPGVLVVDEAYGQFAPWSALTLLDSGQPLVVVRTYSKTWSMAACRLGYAVAPAGVVKAMEQVLLPYHIDAPSQVAGRVALRFREEMKARVARIVDERDRLDGALRDLDLDVWRSAANFVLFRPRSRPGRDVWQALLDRSVLVRDCSAWPGLADCLRVTVGTPEENTAFLAALRDVLGP